MYLTHELIIYLRNLFWGESNACVVNRIKVSSALTIYPIQIWKSESVKEEGREGENMLECERARDMSGRHERESYKREGERETEQS